MTGAWNIDGTVPTFGPFVEKVGLDGTVRFSRRFTATGLGPEDFGSVAVDSQGRIFAVGMVGGSSNTDGLDITAGVYATTAVAVGFDAQGTMTFVRSWPVDDPFPLRVVLTADGHPLIGGTLTRSMSFGGEVLVPASHGALPSSSVTGGCDDCPPLTHGASPFLLELGADGAYLHSRLLEADGAAGITSMVMSNCSIFAVGDADGGQYLAVLAPDTSFVRSYPFRAFADPHLNSAVTSIPMYLAARDDGSFVVGGTFEGGTGPFTFGSLSLEGAPAYDSGFVVDASIR